MARKNRVNVIDSLHTTMRALEDDSQISPENADLAILKEIVVRRIAELEKEDKVTEPSDAT